MFIKISSRVKLTQMNYFNSLSALIPIRAWKLRIFTFSTWNKQDLKKKFDFQFSISQQELFQGLRDSQTFSSHIASLSFSSREPKRKKYVIEKKELNYCRHVCLPGKQGKRAKRLKIGSWWGKKAHNDDHKLGSGVEGKKCYN